ncbi:restriction endonuclease subunit S [Adlercreutzia sp. ZJ304]|uniref:restriction endonuclease subunit S n=1 Tax=Adlercreutzia sp. ZJ304 TaxID=2709791 RepID=UPI0013EC650D|nr:restriction endonuclease subunit S [Adlercreutzia sp. ZJ304]
MNLDISTWQEFDLKDLFGDPVRGTRITQEDREPGDIPFVTAGESDHGISSYISNSEATTHSDAITIDMFCNAFYQKGKFKCDDNILVLKNEKLNELSGNFIVSVLLQDKYRFSYGRQYRQKDYKRHKILLPSTASGEPDWEWMENYMKSLFSNRLNSFFA